MKVLGFDTATNWCTTGLIDDKELIAEWTIKSKMTQLNRLIPGISMLLKEKELKFSDLSAISVTIGPGSFTGVRLGLVTAKTLSQVSGLPVIGINSLEALVFQCPVKNSLIVPVIDARKNQVFAGFYRWEEDKIIVIEEGKIFTPEELAEEINKKQEYCYLTGEGLEPYINIISKNLSLSVTFLPSFYGIIRGATVAIMGKDRINAGYEDSYIDLAPIYIRPPDAKISQRSIYES
jgi:tRNA threonylcarbamoyladenosine biosynthesis protein TsaB